MSNQVVLNERKVGAEVYYGDEICRLKSRELLQEVGLPQGLLPLRDIEECGYVRETGYVWLKQKNKCQHEFKKIGKLVAYATEVSAYVENFKMKKVTGVKAKELLLWVSLVEISVENASSETIYFKSSTGIGKTFPVSAFELEGDEK